MIDSLGLDAKHSEPIPFTYESSHPTQLSQDKSFDFGVIALSPTYQQLLKKNHVQPLHEEVWKCQPSVVDYCALLGIPGEPVTVDSGYVGIAPTLYVIEPLDQRPEGFWETDVPGFYGRVALGQGRPRSRERVEARFFAFRQDAEGRLRYWLAALQSSWLPRPRYIPACRTRVLGDALEAILDEWAAA